MITFNIEMTYEIVAHKDNIRDGGVSIKKFTCGNVDGISSNSSAKKTFFKVTDEMNRNDFLVVYLWNRFTGELVASRWNH